MPREEAKPRLPYLPEDNGYLLKRYREAMARADAHAEADEYWSSEMRVLSKKIAKASRADGTGKLQPKKLAKLLASLRRQRRIIGLEVRDHRASYRNAREEMASISNPFNVKICDDFDSSGTSLATDSTCSDAEPDDDCSTPPSTQGECSSSELQPSGKYSSLHTA